MQSSPGNLSLSQAQCWYLLASYEGSRAYFNRAWVSVGRCTRLVQMMGLYRLDSPDDRSHMLADRSWTDIEEGRRVFWAAYCCDRWSATMSGHPYMIRDEHVSRFTTNTIRDLATSCLADLDMYESSILWKVFRSRDRGDWNLLAGTRQLGDLSTPLILRRNNNHHSNPRQVPQPPTHMGTRSSIKYQPPILGIPSRNRHLHLPRIHESPRPSPRLQGRK